MSFSEFRSLKTLQTESAEKEYLCFQETKMLAVDEGLRDDIPYQLHFADTDGNFRDEERNLMWLECAECYCVLDFPRQLHWCSNGISLQFRHLNFLHECDKCFSVLESPFDSHRCPDKPSDIYSDDDWLECGLCFTILDYIAQSHGCPDGDEGFFDENDCLL